MGLGRLSVILFCEVCVCVRTRQCVSADGAIWQVVHAEALTPKSAPDYPAL